MRKSPEARLSQRPRFCAPRRPEDRHHANGESACDGELHDPRSPGPGIGRALEKRQTKNDHGRVIGEQRIVASHTAFGDLLGKSHSDNKGDQCQARQRRRDLQQVECSDGDEAPTKLPSSLAQPLADPRSCSILATMRTVVSSTGMASVKPNNR